ncbi:MULTISPECIES: response regulator [Xanthocytophaga]|uniref:Response regulator n=2 Tax=Xanthocytophaga TaxID=3078918 RepID=A0AAE3U6Y7_9BACT|nr:MULTISPECIES: response regulator [Xanthocytophaga]MDJ1479583.1 response regulator [Xanthocytophaga flavus]MDJ1501938.1 response regulator [Xanthocytophaga agilis]
MIFKTYTSFCQTIMFIDDNPIDTFIHTRLLKLSEFQGKQLVYDNCFAALDYLTCNQYVGELLPELIFVDLHLPLMSGLEFVEKIKALPGLIEKQCQVVVLSSTYPEPEMAFQMEKSGVWKILEKPLRLEDLKNIYEEVEGMRYAIAS